MSHKVQLALYDLSRGMAKTMSMSIIGKQLDGIWHSGIIVYGKEYFFGGGLQCMPHETFVAMHGGVRPTEYIDLGATDIPQDLFEDFNREVGPRFTGQTYDLMKHNCNNYTDEAAKFLLGKGIPSYIIDLPNEVLNSPMGSVLRPLLEQMTTQMNGADPYSALHHQQAAAQGEGGFGGSVPSSSAPTQASAQNTSRAAASGATAGFPILDKHTKPLVGSDTAKAAASVAARLKALGSSVDGLLSEADAAVLDSLPESLASPKTTPVIAGSFPLMQRIVRKDSGWPEKAEFLALVLMSLMILHNPEGAGMEEAMTEVAARARASEDLSAQSLSIAICAAANAFGTPGGGRYMMRHDVMAGWLEVSLRGLAHPRGEVRQMSSALLNNMSLALATSLPDAADGEDVSDEATQIMFGVLDDLQKETSSMVALRRLLAAGRLLRKLGVAGVSLVNEVGFRDQVEIYASTAQEGEAKGAAGEVLRLLGDV